MNKLLKKFIFTFSLYLIILQANNVYADCAQDIMTGDFNQAVDECTQEASIVGPNQGQALYFLGVLHSINVSDKIPLDQEKSFNLYKQSANLNFVPAYFALSFAYYNGIGVKSDFNEAFIWAKKAAENGDGEGALALAQYYYSGIGTKEDKSQAYLWLTIARLKIDEFDTTSQNFFDSTIGLLETKERVKLFDIATQCLKNNYKNCEIPNNYIDFSNTKKDIEEPNNSISSTQSN